MPTTIYSKRTCKIISRYRIADVCLYRISDHHLLKANVAFTIGEILVKFQAATIQNYPTYLTIQTGRNTHITLEPGFLQYINHSCDPNVYFDTTAMQLVCIRPIQPGDELCSFYPSTEWKMARPFNCNCGSNNCLQFINGAARLGATTTGKYLLTDFILQQLKKKP